MCAGVLKQHQFLIYWNDNKGFGVLDKGCKSCVCLDDATPLWGNEKGFALCKLISY